MNPSPDTVWRARAGRLAWVPAGLLAFALLAVAPRARAADPVFETRTYLDLSLLRAPSPATATAWALGPFVREESRFRDAGLVYVKAFAGARATLGPHLRAALYYAHMDLLAGARRQTHLASLDVFVHAALGPLAVSDKSGFEAHAPDVFFRYRHALELKWAVDGAILVPFVNGELRVDSDSSRIELVNFEAGAELHPTGALSLHVFYGLEGNRRNQPAWSTTHMLGLALSAKL